MSRSEGLAGESGAASAVPDVRGSSVLIGLERLLLLGERLARALVPARLNPFAHTGAIATLTFIVACVSGGLTLIWYSSSVREAFASVEAMTAATYTGGIVRSLHRYSSDACMLFALLHGLKLFAARRFTGPRWLPWVTGVLSLGTLWFIGWIGYWLVWDERAQLVAVGSARVVEVLPIFAEPLSRSFLTDASVNSLLFFMVFFAHMLVPPAMGVLLWIHIVRVSRARWLTDKAMTIWVMASMLLVSIVYPATSAAPAKMAVAPEAFTMDWWYLAPLLLTERLGPGALWFLCFLVGGVALSLPWLLARRAPRRASVELDKCNGCQVCFEDCPYDAIRMVPRPPDAKRSEPLVAQIDPARCVGCGVCAGSCDSAGIGLDWLPVVQLRRRQDARLAGEDPRRVAFVCAESAAERLHLDAEGGCAELPGYTVESVPCAGWVHALTVERALRHGAPGVLVVACGEGSCAWREGTDWATERLAGNRKPHLRADKVDPSQVRVVRLDRGDRRGLVREAEAFARGEPRPKASRGRQIAGGIGLLVALSALMLAPSDAMHTPPPQASALVVSFNHPGERSEACRDATAEELAALPLHMRRQRICERRRASVRLRITVDGEQRLERAYAPRGVSGDGNSTAVERMPLPAGRHRIRIELGDTLDPDAWPHVDERVVEIAERTQQVVLFDKRSGFGWH